MKIIKTYGYLILLIIIYSCQEKKNLVIKQFKDRSSVGIEKYGVTLDRTDLTRLDWINHAQQEAMDLVLYLEKLKQINK